MAARDGRDRAAGRSGGKPPELVLVALGGLGEIGMNVYLYGLGPPDARRWLMVDLGITFPEGEFDPGVDIILPDTRFIEQHLASLEGIVVTHAHEDHLGAVIELWPRLRVPIYATPFAAGMLKAKLAEFGGRLKLPVNTVAVDSRFQLGPFDLELVTMAHSVPETSGLVIRTPLGTIFHTSDWKLEAAPVIGAATDEARLAALGKEGIDILIGDSTNAFRDGSSPSETAVATELTGLIKTAKARVAVTTFASNIARIKAVSDAARAANRQLVVCGRALHRAIQVAIDTGHLPRGFTWLDDEEMQYLERDEVVALVTGSQGEPRAALARIAEKSHPKVQLVAGDTVIFSSRTIPGNEKEVGRIQNLLALAGCRIVTDNEALVHVTGHPRREELKRMYAWMQAKVAIPMHGEVRHLLEHARIAKAAGVPDVRPITNGRMVRLAPGPTQIVAEVPTGRLYRDGRMIVPSDAGPVQERRKLAFVGLIAVSIVLSKRGEVLAKPEVILDGVPEQATEARSMSEIVTSAVDGTLAGIPLPRRKESDMLREAVRRSVRSAVDDIWGKKPIVKVLLTQLEA